MANTSIEKRLQTLQQKRDALDAEIKKIQAEKSRALRKRQQQREALVGKVIYRLIDAGEAIKDGPWSEDDLLALMGQHLTRQRERQLFGLAPLSKGDGKAISSPAAAEKSRKKTEGSGKERSKSSAGKSATEGKKSLPVSSNQDELASEFNL